MQNRLRSLLIRCPQVVWVFLLAATNGAQAQVLHQLRHSYLPLDQDLTRALAYGDVDGDGDLDVIVGNDSSAALQTRQVRVLLNDGRGVLVDASEGRIPFDYDPTTALELVDVDGDGDLDLLVAKLSVQNRLYRNDGTGAFTDVTAQALPVDTARTVTIAVGDTDGDGDVDIVFGNSWPSGRQNLLYENDGSGTFANATSARLPLLDDPTADIALADFDADGDLDLLTVNGSFLGLNRMMWNDGTGTFSLVGGPQLPAQYDHTSSVTVGDVDGDQDLDIIVGNRISLPYHDGRDRILINDGSGRFVDETDARIASDTAMTEDITLGDIDGDSDLDLIVAIAGQNRLYVNDGAGLFAAAATPLPSHYDASRALARFDVDGDGDLDLMFGNAFIGLAEQNRIYINDGLGGFADGTTVRGPVGTAIGKTAVLFDADGDGDRDLVTGYANSYQLAGQLSLNDGAGLFTEAPPGSFPATFGDVRDLVARDFDGDGDTDVVLALGWQQQSLFFANVGGGVFVDESFRLPVANVLTAAVAASDVDGDGDVDLVMGNHYGQDLLYLNNGSGVFVDATVTRMPTDVDWAGDLAFGDVDGDGDADLVVANEGTQNRLYLNSGAGFFMDATALSMPTDMDRSLEVAIGDVDGDQDLDLVFGNSNEQQNRVYLNNGAGVFTDATAAKLPVDADSTEGIALGDLDGDGDLDLVTGNRGAGFVNRLLRNDGTGGFVEVEFDHVLNWTADMVLADVDDDGDLDVVQVNNGEQLVMVNQQRQLVAPVFPSLGRAFYLDVSLHPGELQQPGFFVPLLAVSRLPSAVTVAPLGAVWLAPPVVALPAVIVPAPAGKATASFAIPSGASLVGIELHAQALLGESAVLGGLRLTNLVSDTVLP